jgi:hypothetical protein
MRALQEVGMGRYGIAAIGIAALSLVCLGIHGEAFAAQLASVQAQAATDVSSQQRARRSRTRITVYPRGIPLVGPRYFGFDPYPRPYPYDWPGPLAKRDCVGWLAWQRRPSGPVVVPLRRCWWVFG